MRRIVFSLSLAASLCTPAFAAQTEIVADFTPLGAATTTSSLAPADVQFGAFGMSVLGIANEIRLAGSRFDDSTPREQLERGAFAYTVDAIRDWEHKYPSDPAIPRSLLAIARTYGHLHSEAAHELAGRALNWLSRDYPGSAATATARTEFGIGEPRVAETRATDVHPAEVHALPPAQAPQTSQAPRTPQAPVLPSYAVPGSNR